MAIVEGKQVIIVGDRVICNCPGGPHTIVSGSPTNFFHGISMCRVGDKSSCGVTIITGSERFTMLGAGRLAALDGSLTSCGGYVQADMALRSRAQAGGAPPLNAARVQASRMSEAAPHATQSSLASTSPTINQRPPYEIPANSGYWPPYNPLTREELNVVYVRPAIEIAVLTKTEAEEFLANLYEEHSVKGQLDTTRQVWGSAEHARDAYHIAKGLGGLGVMAYEKRINGRDYVIIRGYKRHQQTLMRGNRWRSNNPRVVQLGLGSHGARAVLRVSVVLDIAWATATNAVDAIIRDDRTMEDFVGRSGMDIAKGVVTTGLGLAAAAGVSSVLTGGLIFAGIVLLVGISLDQLDNHFGISDQLVERMKGEAQ